MKTKLPISFSITILIAFHLVIIFASWLVLSSYNDSIKNDAKIINSLGQIRGGTQKCMKEFFYNGSLDGRAYIDKKFAAIEELTRAKFTEHHQSITDLQNFWKKMADGMRYCSSKRCKARLYKHSQIFWDKSDLVVTSIEHASEEKNDLINFIFVILFIEILFVSFMIIVVYTLVSETLEAQKRTMENYIAIVDRYVITSSTDLKGIITYVSDAFCKISGYSKDELLGKNHNIVRHEDMPKSLYEAMWNSIKKGETWSGQLKNKKKNGSYYWVQANISAVYEEGKHIGYTAVREDITDKKMMEELSVTDPMTGLYNRRKFYKVVTGELSRIQRAYKDKEEQNDQLFFILLDVDHFKQYNDNYGHDQGDKVLNEIANVLHLSLRRASDYAFRLGGEEFGVIVTDENIIGVKQFVNSIKEEIEAMKIKHEHNSASDYITASFGISISNEHFGYDFDTLYNRADKALYRAKKLGRNRVEVYKVTREYADG